MQLKWEKSEYHDKNAGALEYMEQRYGEKFEYVGLKRSAFYDPNSRSIFVSCESLPGKEILVEIIKDGKEEKYYDNYMEYYFENQVNDFIIDLAKNYFYDATFKSSITAVALNSSIDMTTTFAEYICSKYYFVRGHLDVIGESNEETVRKFADELVTRGIQFSISVNIPSINEGYNIRYFDEDDEIYIRRRTLK